ncbi:MAG: hypothetical protein QNK23_12235 [Crocinitomicaceae bacterium]|nr:hypothetical protein [Crocinitomicaceae bacterium]
MKELSSEQYHVMTLYAHGFPVNKISAIISRTVMYVKNLIADVKIKWNIDTPRTLLEQLIKAEIIRKSALNNEGINLKTWTLSRLEKFIMFSIISNVDKKTVMRTLGIDAKKLNTLRKSVIEKCNVGNEFELTVEALLHGDLLLTNEDVLLPRILSPAIRLFNHIEPMSYFDMGMRSNSDESDFSFWVLHAPISKELAKALGLFHEAHPDISINQIKNSQFLQVVGSTPKEWREFQKVIYTMYFINSRNK